MKHYEITIISMKFDVFCEASEVWARVSVLMSQECPPNGTIPGIREISDPASAVAIVATAPATAISVSTPTALAPSRAPIALAAPISVVSIVYSPAPTRTGEYTINAADEGRTLADLEAAKAAGWAIEQTVYRTGRPVIQDGRDNAALSYRTWDALPEAGDALISLRDRVRRENRRDVSVKGADLRLTDAGILRVPGIGDLTVPRRTWGTLAARTGIPHGAGYLSACAPKLRAINFNNWVAGNGAIDPTWEPGSFKLRIRDGRNGKPELYGVVGETYAALDTDAVCELLARGLPQGGRAETFYDGYRTRAIVTWHSDIRPENYVVGEYFKAGMRFSCDDTGGGSISGVATLLRNLCLNLIILHEAEQTILQRAHRGAVDKIVSEVRAGIAKGRSATAHFVEQWSKARGADQTLRSIVVEAEDPHADLSHVSLDDLAWGVFLAAQRRETLPINQRDVASMFGAWTVEGRSDPTRAGIVNGVTRFAQLNQADPWRADELEKAAGRMLASSKPIPWINPRA
jgi:hypothetical protein